MAGSTSLEYENVLKVIGIPTCRISQGRLWQTGTEWALDFTRESSVPEGGKWLG